jgi:hypothetical protein
MSASKLTEAHISQIKRDMNEQVEMLSDAQVNALAQKVNKVINLPFLNEEKELKVFAKVVKLIDKEIYKLLPNEYYGLVQDSSDGISKEEAVQIEERLTPLLTNSINIPVLSEKLEEKLIRLILGLITNAMVKGSNLEEVEPAK